MRYFIKIVLFILHHLYSICCNCFLFIWGGKIFRYSIIHLFFMYIYKAIKYLYSSRRNKKIKYYTQQKNLILTPSISPPFYSHCVTLYMTHGSSSLSFFLVLSYKFMDLIACIGHIEPIKIKKRRNHNLKKKKITFDFSFNFSIM